MLPMLSIPAAAFTPTSPDSPYGSNLILPGFTHVITVGQSVGTSPAWAWVNLPTGAALDFIDLYYDDLFLDADICAALHAYGGPTLGGDPPSDVTIGTVC
jgi:hypothetical protein